MNSPRAVIRVPPGTEDNDLGAEQEQDDKPVRGRVGMCDAAPDGAAVAHRAVGDPARRRREPTVAGIGHRTVLDLGVGHGGAVDDGVAVVAAATQIGARAHIDEEIRLHQPQVQHRAQRLSPGDRFRETLRRGQILHRVGRAARSDVAERDGLHGMVSPPAAMIFSSSFRMVIGAESTSAPSHDSASLTAFAIAAGGPIAPPSPMPFWPNRV